MKYNLVINDIDNLIPSAIQAVNDKGHIIEISVLRLYSKDSMNMYKGRIGNKHVYVSVPVKYKNVIPISAYIIEDEEMINFDII